MTEEKKKWSREEIEEKVKSDDRWLYRAILAIFDKQTADEKIEEETKHHNGVGFTGVDAPFFSSLAKWLKRVKDQSGTMFLTPKQKTAARKQIVKYCGQLTKIANGEI